MNRASYLLFSLSIGGASLVYSSFPASAQTSLAAPLNKPFAQSVLIEEPAAEIPQGEAPANLTEEDPGIVAPVSTDRFTTSPGGVELRSGSYLYNVTDLSMGNPDAGTGIALVRSSDDKQHVERMAQFTHNWEIFLTQEPTRTVGAYPDLLWQVTVRAMNKAMTFRTPPFNTTGSTYNTVNPSSAKLQRLPTGSTTFYKYTAEDGSVINFSPSGVAGCGHSFTQFPSFCAYATDMTLPNGVKYTFSYDNTGGSSARLRSVVSNTGFAILFEYTTGAGGRPLVSKACVLNKAFTTMPATPTCPVNIPTTTYQYTGDFVSSVTDVKGNVWSFQTTYTNATTPYTQSYFRPGESVPYLVNSYYQEFGDDYFRVVDSQVFAGGPTYWYAFGVISQGDFNPGAYSIRSANYSDGNGTVAVRFGAYRPPKVLNDRTWYITPNPDLVTDQLGRTHQADYCIPFGVNGGCRVVEMQYAINPEGIRTDYTYDANLNVIQTVTHAKAGRGLADLISTFTYSCGTFGMTCKKPASETKPGGQTTNYTYVDVHGGIASEMKPAPVLNGPRPLKLTSWVQKYAYVRNSLGTLVAETTPVWVVSSETECETAAASSSPFCGSGSTQIVTNYVYGADGTANNLLLRSKIVDAGGLNLRTCYTYDGSGNKISETAPKGAVSTCP